MGHLAFSNEAMMQEDHSTAVSQLIGCPVVYRGHERESSGPVSTLLLFILFFYYLLFLFFMIILFTSLFNKVCMTTTDAAGS